ncbi:Aspartate--tRNA(Asp/Asn) ligase [Labeo rohita]|uniref:Aspartate--tRNA(Asp/Asn) ligase n=1 Tax=Labeo rohita TaxID=84645 RepID=A0ABQ8L098_LABRO|nr:Aspartate--tRNA(Asp/Asn) ligase [Labeo rohita]
MNWQIDKRKECKHPGSGEGLNNGKPTAETWPRFVLMDEMLGQRPSISPPVLVASLPDEEPRAGCSSVEITQDAEQEDRPVTGQSARPRKRKSKSDSLLELLKEDMARQKEWEDRRDAEDRARSDRLFSLLEKLIDKM